MFRAKIAGTGMYVPEKVLTNDDLSKMVETNDEWITERTGIKERRIADLEKGEVTTEMARQAAVQAIEAAGIQPNDIDCILLCTTTPDYLLPNAAVILQQKLEMTNKCAAMDLVAACSGFVYGVNVGNSMIQSGMFKRILVCGAEFITNRVDFTDRNTCILFGDGCGAAIIERNEDDSDSSEILSTIINSDGAGADFFIAECGGSAMPMSHEGIDQGKQYMKMQGQAMFKTAVRTMAENSAKVLEMAQVPPEKVDWVVPHQANLRIIEVMAKQFKFPMDKVIVNIEKYGNTSAASVPIALHEAVTDGKIKKGDTVLLTAFGAGFTAGATLMRF